MARRLQTLLDLRYVGHLLLPGRQSTNAGAVGYESVESIFAADTPEAVTPGSEYTITTTGDGAANLANVVKWGKDTFVTDEAIQRRNMNPVNKSMQKLVNSAALSIDTAVVTAISSAVTQTRAAEAVWTDDSLAKILRDILRAAQDIRANNLGYEPNVLLVSDAVWAYLASNPNISTLMAREDKSNTVYNGRFERLAGLEVVHAPTANLPGGLSTVAWVLDTSALGFIATEDLGGGYQSAGDLVESKVMRNDEIDSWRLRARANYVPVVTDPNAGFKITAVTA